MARQARGEDMDPTRIQVFHCVHRCVRRAFLCGKDPYSGTCYDHRRQWIRERLEFLASVFGIDCLTYTVMSNHLHLILRSRPDVVQGWSDQEVARRWRLLFPGRRNRDGLLTEPTPEEIAAIVHDPVRLSQIRQHLSDISWWARCTAETIGRLSNREDNVTGHFWEGRYKSQQLTDEAAVLACASYVDLNPVRAAVAETPENSTFTGARDRIDDLREREEDGSLTDHDWERTDACQSSGWMSPIEIDEQADPVGAAADSTGRRASAKGFLQLSLSAYLELLDWTGRQVRRGKRGSIPGHLAPILNRLGLQPRLWCEAVASFGRSYRRSLGTARQLSGSASRQGYHGHSGANGSGASLNPA